MQTLYDEARTLTHDFVTRTEDHHFLADRLIEATHELARTICLPVERSVEAAATLGATHVDIFRFHGNDIDERSHFPLLALLKGSRDPGMRAILQSKGYTNLLETLQLKLAPFTLRHIWHARSNLNRLVLSWDVGTTKGLA